MGDQPKKISFGFTKTKSVSSVIVKPPVITEEKIQYIECIDNSNIKVLGVNEDDKPNELIIPLLNPRSSLISRKTIVTNSQDADDGNDDNNPENVDIKKEKIDEIAEKVDDMKIKQETLEEQAARELLEDAQNKDKETERTTLVLEIPPSESMFDANKESTIDDYEQVPIQDFGLAMLRGMGWKPSDTKKKEETKELMVRPKGLGLGADLSIIKNLQAKNNKSDDGHDLKLAKNAYVQIIMGKDQGKYGQIESFDDDDRIIVKLALERTSVSINGSLIRLVSKTEYDLKSKVLNTRQYDDFVKNGDKKSTNQSNLIKSDNEEEEEEKGEKKKKKSHKHHHRKKSKKRSRSDSRSRSRSVSKEREKIKKHKKKEHKKRSRSRSRERERHRRRN